MTSVKKALMKQVLSIVAESALGRACGYRKSVRKGVSSLAKRTQKEGLWVIQRSQN